ncbi:MAG: helix-turn-helix transcriptional regulator [Clostridiales bacterium]|nr:helix-turn-helix transcriptional regulator [Clostridiales bacterium]
MDVLARITALRERRNWTIWKLSEESGVDQSTISAWYKKGRSPSVSSLQKICEAFHMTMSQFFSSDNSSVELSPDQWEMLENWSALSTKQKEIVLTLIKNMPTQND